MTFTKKCLTCPKVDLSKSKSLTGKDLMCKETNDFCKNSWKKCSDKRVTCEMCSNFKDDYCQVDKHFKSGNSFRICNNYS